MILFGAIFLACLSLFVLVAMIRYGFDFEGCCHMIFDGLISIALFWVHFTN